MNAPANQKRAQSFIELYKQQMERLRQTQSIEWKCNFGVWTLLAGAIYFVAQHSVPIPIFAAGLVLCLFVVLHGVWLYKIHQSEQVDKKFWVRYRKEALQLLRSDSHIHGDEAKADRSALDEVIWLSMVVGVTSLLCAVLFFVLITAHQTASPLVNEHPSEARSEPYGNDPSLSQKAAGNNREPSVSVTSLPPIHLAEKSTTYWDRIFDWGPWIFNLLLVVVGGMQVLLLLRTWKTIARQADIQEASMTQWVDLQPDGLMTTAEIDSDPQPKTVTIQPRWRIVNNTPLPFTLETIETHVERNLGWEISRFDCDQTIAPAKDAQNFFAFFAPVKLTESETTDFFSGGLELSIMVGITYRGASGKQERRSFGDFYVCKLGKLEINKPIGKGPQDQRIEKDDNTSTLVRDHVRILEEEEPTAPPD